MIESFAAVLFRTSIGGQTVVAAACTQMVLRSVAAIALDLTWLQLVHVVSHDLIQTQFSH
jgi:hypothetical protein